MAHGYAHASGNPGAALVVPGVGLYNAAAGVATACARSSPVLVIAGQVPRAAIGENAGAVHEVLDQADTVRSVTKWRGGVMRPREIPAAVNEVFRRMRGKRAARRIRSTSSASRRSGLKPPIRSNNPRSRNPIWQWTPVKNFPISSRPKKHLSQASSESASTLMLPPRAPLRQASATALEALTPRVEPRPGMRGRRPGRRRPNAWPARRRVRSP